MIDQTTTFTAKCVACAAKQPFECADEVAAFEFLARIRWARLPGDVLLCEKCAFIFRQVCRSLAGDLFKGILKEVDVP
jgi:hypothetical protein